jgi:hypothetical protein
MQPAEPLPMMEMPGCALVSNPLRGLNFAFPPSTFSSRTEEDHRQVSSSRDDQDYRNLAVNRLRPSELHWALNHDAVHGIAYAFKNPVAVAESIDDPDDDRMTYLIRVKRDDLANALGKINHWITENPGPAGMQAFGFVRALSREGLTERSSGDDERR